MARAYSGSSGCKAGLNPGQHALPLQGTLTHLPTLRLGQIRHNDSLPGGLASELGGVLRSSQELATPRNEEKAWEEVQGHEVA